ncbi:MAG: methyltransferase domain-containing protein [Candidatus Eremiobacteraeota bacterium]|nr:methyltransferase domain-containing protein [Candidatus Eremiobacteraeota bacterium]
MASEAGTLSRATPLVAVRCDLCGGDRSKMTLQKRGALDDRLFTIVRCIDCGLVYVNPRLDDDAINRLYDEAYFHGRGFDRTIGWDLRPIDEVRRDSRPFVATLDEAMGGLGGRSVLDIGCGFGGFVRALLAEGAEAYGLDDSPIAVKACEQNGTPLLAYTIDELVAAGKRFDAVTMIEVLEHVTSPRAFLQSAVRLLKPGGVLYVSTGNWNFVRHDRLDPGTPYIMPEGHIYYFTPVTLRRYFRVLSLEPIDVMNRAWVGSRRLQSHLGPTLTHALASIVSRVAPGYGPFPLARRPA